MENSFTNNELIYDLRQTYAEIVSEVLRGIAIARQEKNFVLWYDFLENLHTEINQKLTGKERESYQTKKKETIEVLTKNKLEYLGKSNDNDKKHKVYTALKNLELWLREKMETHKMFGAKEDVQL